MNRSSIYGVKSFVGLAMANFLGFKVLALKRLSAMDLWVNEKPIYEALDVIKLDLVKYLVYLLTWFLNRANIKIVFCYDKY